MTLLYNLTLETAPEVYRTLGIDYEDVLVLPQLRSHPNTVLGHWSLDIGHWTFYSPRARAHQNSSRGPTVPSASSQASGVG